MFEYRATFSHEQYGLLTGFCSLDSIYHPQSGDVTFYVPSIRRYVDSDWSKATDVMLLGGELNFDI